MRIASSFCCLCRNKLLDKYKTYTHAFQTFRSKRGKVESWGVSQNNQGQLWYNETTFTCYQKSSPYDFLFCFQKCDKTASLRGNVFNLSTLTTNRLVLFMELKTFNLSIVFVNPSLIREGLKGLKLQQNSNWTGNCSGELQPPQ